MSTPYIPRRQGDLLVLARSAAEQLSAAPYRFGSTPQEAAYFQGYVDDFVAKMAVVTEPGGCTKSAVQAKEDSVLKLLRVMRPLFQTIKMDAGVSGADKIALGVPIDGARRQQVPAPATAPDLLIVAAMRRQQILKYNDGPSPTRKAKPADVIALELFCQVGDEPEISVRYARSIALVTRQPYVVTFEEADVGLLAHYWARWVTRRGKRGPWSVPVSMTVA